MSNDDETKCLKQEEKDPQIDCFGMKMCLYQNYLMPNIPHFVESSQWLKNHYVPSNNELFIVSYPKCGTTLTQQICYEIMHCVYKNSASSSTDINTQNHSYYRDTRGMHGIYGWIENERARGQDIFDKHLTETQDTERIWKTHAPLNHFPCKQMPRKMVIVCRNPKDCLISYYYHVINAKASNVYDFKKGFDEMFMIWCLGLVENNSFFTYYQSYWNLYQQNKTKKNTNIDILWLYYEDFVESDDSKRKQIKKLIQFMQVEDLVHEKQDLDNILVNSGVEKMSKQYEKYVVKNFVRNGVCGDWKNHLNETQNQMIDNLVYVHFNHTDFKYYKDLKDKKEYLCLR